MRVLRFECREEWLNWRLGKLTGSKLKKVVSFDGRKGEYRLDGEMLIGEYEAAAESLLGSQAIAEDYDDEKAMARGTRLEPVAVQRFVAETGKKAVWCHDDLGWERDDDPRIAISPDAVIGVTEAVEAKCLTAANHLKALDTGEVPKEYQYQVLHYFVVNEKLRKLYVVFYDDRFPAGLDFFYIEVKRKDVKKKVDALLEHLRGKVSRVRSLVTRVSERIEVQPQADAIQAEAVVVEEPQSSLDRVYQGVKARSLEV